MSVTSLPAAHNGSALVAVQEVQEEKMHSVWLPFYEMMCVQLTKIGVGYSGHASKVMLLFSERINIALEGAWVESGLGLLQYTKATDDPIHFFWHKDFELLGYWKWLFSVTVFLNGFKGFQGVFKMKI